MENDNRPAIVLQNDCVVEDLADIPHLLPDPFELRVLLDTLPRNVIEHSPPFLHRGDHIDSPTVFKCMWSVKNF